MRLRYWTALALVVGVGVGLTFREGRQGAEDRAGAPLSVAPESAQPADMAKAGETVPPPDAASPEAEPADEERPQWSRSVGPGESLDMLLADAGLDAPVRAEVSRALGSQFDLRKLQPGHVLALDIAEGQPRSATLEVDDGVRIRATFGASPSVRVLSPTLETVSLAGETRIAQSIFAALDKGGIPTRFAIDLELVFAGRLDLRRRLAGGETLRVSWRERRLGERVIGDPIIDYAELDLGDARYEVIWPDDNSRRTSILRDGRPVLAFDQPVRGARLSSAFGMREHPIHGFVRMHSGVDFAAEQGAAVYATQAGRVAFFGQRSGYGLMIEIDHGRNVRTIYAHLSAVSKSLRVGQRIGAGHEIGKVGSTGTSTAPHLHYEVRVDDRPVAPLTDKRLSEAGQGPEPTDATFIDDARNHLSQLLARNE